MGPSGTALVRSFAYLDEVHFKEVLVVARSLNIEDGDDVFVVEVSEKLHFAKCPQTKHGVIKRGNLFDRNLLPGRLVKCGAGKELAIRLENAPATSN